MQALLLVPSPLLGPSSWSALASAAHRRGLKTATVDLRPAFDLEPPLWPEMIRLAGTAAGSLPGQMDVVAHSGAGAILPAVGAALGPALRRLVFVDAVLPPTTGAHRYPTSIKGLAADLAGNETHLPPWLDWWPPATVEEMLPDPDHVARLRSDIPRVPLAWFDESVPVPVAWTDGDATYLRLSAAYDEETRRAEELGWPTRRLDSHHLGIVTDPDRVLGALGD